MYGSLMKSEIRIEVFNREIDGELDTLQGFRSLPHVGRMSLKPDGHSLVEGLVIELKKPELAKADRHVGPAYKRKRFTLSHGKRAWVYLPVTS